jgi:uncharacterized protein YybS (DUF2232 family)
VASARGSAHALVEGALLAGLGVVLVFAAIFLPVVGPLLVVIWPLPVTVACVRHGPRSGVLVGVVTAILLSLFQGVLTGVLVGVLMVAIGVADGWGIAGRRDAWLTVAVASVSSAFVMLASFGASLLFLKQNLLSMMVGALGEVGKQVAALAGSGTAAAPLTQAINALQTLIPELWPTMLALGAVSLSLFVYLAGMPILRRLDVDVPDMLPFAAWRLPWPAVAGWVAGSVILQFHSQHDALYLAGLNLSYLFSEVFTIAGMALLYAVLRHFHAARGLAAVICALAFINGLFSVLLLWAGLFDALFDYRRFLRARA